MLEFKGFSDWIEIFRGGVQTDSAGVDHNGDALIEKAIATFDPAYHEPPAVLGHPKDDAPAYGWVEAVKEAFDGDTRVLLAKFKDVADGFEEAVKSGRFKKRSAAFYPDGRLRHVGWLGAMPPAVKGLADVKFSEEPATTFTFTETKGEKEMKFSDFLQAVNIFKKMGGKDEDIDLLAPTKPANQPGAGDGKSFTEADLEAARTKAAEEAKAKAEAEFAEAEKEKFRKAAKVAIAAFCDSGVKAGTLAPAWIDAGLKTFMEGLEAQNAIAFSEGKEKQTQAAWFKEFLSGLPKLVNFEEIAKRETDTGDGTDQEKRDQLITAFMEKNQGADYKDAVLAVSEKHPDLFKNR